MRVPKHSCVRHLPEVVVAVFAAGSAGACGDDRASARPEASPTPSRPPPAERVVPPCRFDEVLPGARVASRDLDGPWIFGQATFEYVKVAARSGTRYVNHNDVGGTSYVGWRGEALVFELPPNTSLHADSLLRHGPPPTIAYRADVSAPHHIAVVACPTDRPAPYLDLSRIHPHAAADPVTAAPIGALVPGGGGPHPTETFLWDTRPEARITHTLEVPLEAGDLVRLTASSARGGGTLDVAFDVAVTPQR